MALPEELSNLLGGGDYVKSFFEMRYGGLTALLYAVFLGWYPCRNKPAGTWFAYHPLCMSIGMVGCYIVAVMLKVTKKGYINTAMHGYFMTAGTLLGLFAFYVIYTQKITLGKDHFTTTHGQVGLVAMVVALVLQFVGSLLLNPDFGLMKTSTSLRAMHKYAGRFSLLLAWGAIVSGFIKMEEDNTTRVAALLPLGMYAAKMVQVMGLSLKPRTLEAAAAAKAKAKAVAKADSAMPPAPSGAGAGAGAGASTSLRRKVEKKPPHAKA